MRFRKPLCTFLLLFSCGETMKEPAHAVYQGPTQCNVTMRETPAQHIWNTPNPSLWGLFSIVFYYICMQLNIKREINVCSHLSANVLICTFQPRAYWIVSVTVVQTFGWLSVCSCCVLEEEAAQIVLWRNKGSWWLLLLKKLCPFILLSTAASNQI